jgi:HD-GYP domain-containing protein (c-di-GMP phosphodiesterase class II)
VGLVDAFDAIVHDRPYRDAGSPANAIEEIVAEAGHQFDPDLVERFEAIVERNDLDETDDRLRIDSLAALRASSQL